MTERLRFTEIYNNRNIARVGIDESFGTYYTGEAIDKLAEYETAEEEGRLLIFQCKVGDTVYVIEERYYNCQWHTGVQKGCVYGFEYDKEWLIWVSLEGDDTSSRNAYKFSNFGKTVFLTHEEAVKALEEMKKNE